MHAIRKRLVRGVVAGGVGLLAMELVKRITAPFVKLPRAKPTDVLATGRSISPFGPQHGPEEGATSALGRLAYEKVVGNKPSDATKRRLSWAVHITYGLSVAAAYGALRGQPRHVLRDGLLFGTGLWLLGDELAAPLLGLTDKPSAYDPTQHLQAFAQHIGFGVATAAAARALEESP